MPIKNWPSAERPREKLLVQGPAALSDAELLSIFLRTGTAGKTAVDLGRELLQTFGNLRKIIAADLNTFCKIPGLGLAKYVQCQALVEIGLRYLYETLKFNDILLKPQDTYRYLTAKLRGYEHEVFACLFLNTANQVIHFKELFHGTINAAAVHPREVAKQALAVNAAAVIFAHNHPSGNASPSEADKSITQQLKQALALVEIQVLDHIIIGEGDITSFAEQGLL